MASKNLQSLVPGYPLLTLAVITVSVLSFLSAKTAGMLIFDRTAILQGEIWRLLTAHFVHFSAMQLFYNLLVFAVAGWIIEKKSPLLFSYLYISTALTISSALFMLEPSMIYYGGLSGIACGFGFYAALLGLAASSPWRKISLLLILLVPVKIVLETCRNSSILPYWGEQTFVTMPASHLTGMVAALLFYAFMKAVKLYWPHARNYSLQ